MNLRSRAAAAAAATLLAVTGAAAAGCAASGEPADGSLADGPPPGASATADATPPQLLRMEIVDRHPWDDSAFTQGLEVEPDGSLLVGTGQYGESAVYRIRDWRGGGEPEQRRELPAEFFGEGLTRAGDTVWQLTWREGTAIARDAETLEETRRADVDVEGWGICHFDAAGDAPARLVTSDGTGTLTFRDPVSFAPTGTVEVTASGNPVTHLNELDCVDGPDGPEVWANVWLTNEIGRIDPETGRVTAYADLSPLVEELTPEQRERADVLNGIARIPGTDRFLVSGKLWPTLYEVRFTSG